MSTKLTLGLAACLLLPCGLGCSANPEIVRGQSPSAEPFSAAPPVQAVEQPVYGAGQPIYAHPASYPRAGGPGFHDAAMPYGFAGDACRACMGLGCAYCGSDGCFGYGFRPKHRHTYKYKDGDWGKHKGYVGYTYPAPNQPPAYVQYPYYTHKGPSDFFLP